MRRFGIHCIDLFIDDVTIILLPNIRRTYSYKATSLEEWTSILALADKWSFYAISQAAIEGLGNSTLDDIIKIVHACRLPDINRPWVTAAFRAVCTREEPLSYYEGKSVGFRILTGIATVRERYIRVGRQIDIDREITREIIEPLVANTAHTERTVTEGDFNSSDEVIERHRTYYFTNHSHDTIVFLVSGSVRYRDTISLSFAVNVPGREQTVPCPPLLPHP